MVAEGLTRAIVAGSADRVLTRVGELCGPLLSALNSLGGVERTPDKAEQACSAIDCLATVLQFCGNVRLKVPFTAVQ